MTKEFSLIDHPNNPLDNLVFLTRSESELMITPASERARFNCRIAQSNLAKANLAFGLELPSRIGEMNSDKQRSALSVGPDEWLLMAAVSEQDAIEESFTQIVDGTLFSLVDVGHRTVGINLSGSSATHILNSGCPLDLEKMPDNSCTRSVLDKVQILIIKHNDKSYRLEIVRSFAEFAWKLLTTAGSEFTITDTT